MMLPVSVIFLCLLVEHLSCSRIFGYDGYVVRIYIFI